MTRAGEAAIRRVHAIMTKTKSEFVPSASRAPRDGQPRADRTNPAEEALTRLLQTELAQARADAPALVEQCDPGRVWLLWFSIGATEEICRLTQHRGNDARDRMFRHVVATIFGDGTRSQSHPAKSPSRLIELFETAGSEAIRACMRGDTSLGYYLGALKASWSLMAEPLPHRAD
jgi:hypothetical protein